VFVWFGGLLVLSGGVLVAPQVLLARYEGAVGSADLFGDQTVGAPERRRDITDRSTSCWLASTRER
jgi:hypothetical protein